MDSFLSLDWKRGWAGFNSMNILHISYINDDKVLNAYYAYAK